MERRELEYMPFDRNGLHATGYEVLIDGIWWNEYEDEDGNLEYLN